MDTNGQEFFYWLGFIYADGCLTICKKTGKKRITVSSSIKDKNHILKFCKFFNININETNTYLKKTQKWYKGCCGKINTKKVCNFIVDNYGLVQRKSSVNTPLPNIPQNYIHHFIRGYFDGDGHVGIKPTISNYKRPNRIYNQLRFAIYNGTPTIIEDMAVILRQISGAKLKTHRRQDYNVNYIACVGNNVCTKLYNYLYKDATVYLERKKKIFETII